MKVSTVPHLSDVAFEYKRPDRTNDRPPTKAEQASDTAQRGSAAAGLSIEVVEDSRSHALFRSRQVFCQADRLVSDEGIRRAGLHDVHPNDCWNETAIAIESKCDLTFA